MKTRYKIIISVIIVMVVFYLVPPNVAGYTCNELDIKDIHCHVVGMNFLGIKFDTNLWYMYNWQDRIGCGGVLAHPDKAYPCSGMESYWGLPTEYALYMEMEHYIPNKNQYDKTMTSDSSLPTCTSTREMYNDPPTCMNEYWPEYPNYVGEIKNEN
ncbi:MAG: hypothetical protein KC444_06140 [Nitrosopumilus sp.]|nr:hypothetical protein [Nitrosopumilus sp.]